MPELPRDLPHLYLRGSGKPEPYTSKIPPPRRPLPQRDRATHAEALRAALAGTFEGVEVRRREREIGVASPGFYLDFEMPAGSEHAAELLENRRRHIELVTVRQEAPTSAAVATVFVPDSAANHFLRKIDQYATESTKKGAPKNEALVARIQNISVAALRSIYTDDPDTFPAAGEEIWWEIWIRQGHVEAFDESLTRFEIPAQHQRLDFPDREVRLVYGNELSIARLFVNSDAIAEVRRAKDTPGVILRLSNIEQARLAGDLAGRIAIPEEANVAVCILDTGVTQAHPLIAPALDVNDVHRYDPVWPLADNRGHGTNMAGIALYGDLMPLLDGNGPVTLTHRLESVKILPDEGENEPRLYGAITGESVARAEVQAPARRRAICMAVTSSIGTSQGRPSSWSAAVDKLCFDDPAANRLVLISGGTIRDGITQGGYPARNETESIENPAQAWNAVTVGAYTEKQTIIDPSYAGWQPVAPAGDLCPTSRTSLMWQRNWPIKPDIVLEGGNWAAMGDQCDCPDDLGILTTYRDPTI